MELTEVKERSHCYYNAKVQMSGGANYKCCSHFLEQYIASVLPSVNRILSIVFFSFDSIHQSVRMAQPGWARNQTQRQFVRRTIEEFHSSLLLCGLKWIV